MEKTVRETALEQMSIEELKERRTDAVEWFKNASSPQSRDWYEFSIYLIGKVLNAKQQLLLNFDGENETDK